MVLPLPSISCGISKQLIFCKEMKAPAFNRDRCCHRALCLWLILFHWARIGFVFFEVGKKLCLVFSIPSHQPFPIPLQDLPPPPPPVMPQHRLRLPHYQVILDNTLITRLTYSLSNPPQKLASYNLSEFNWKTDVLNLSQKTSFIIRKDIKLAFSSFL
jgi:hypothetical protein